MDSTKTQQAQTAQQNHQDESIGHISEASNEETPSTSSFSESEKKKATVNVSEVDDEPIPDILLPAEMHPERPILKGKLQESFLDYWWQELVACAVMLLAVSGIVIVLAVHNGQPLPKWPLKLTLNTVISILITLMKAMMLAILTSGLGQQKWLWFKKKSRPLAHYQVYDKAPSGPSGATNLVFVLRGRQFIACLGAAIIIVTQGLDPFAQQVIHFRTHVAPSKVSNATLPRSSVYDITGYHLGAGESTMDNEMGGAIMAGFYTPGSDYYSISVTGCTTGNCNFSTTYDTIQMCSFCTDVTPQVNGTCSDFAGVEETYYGCNYTMPAGLVLESDNMLDQWLVSNNGDLTTYQTPATQGNVFLREFLWNTANSTAFANPGNGTCEGTACPVKASDCFLYPCVGTYNASVVNSTLTEHLVSTVTLPYSYGDGGPCWSNLKRECLGEADKATLLKQGLDVNDYTDEFIPYCISENNTYDPSTISSQCYYSFDVVSLFSWNYFSSDFLVGNLTGFAALAVEGPVDLSFMWDLGNISTETVDATFKSMASTISDRMRVAGESIYSAPAQGQILITTTVIHVEWLWLLLPLGMVAFTLVFIGMTMVQTTTKGHKPIGKTFSIGLLLSGVAGQVTDQLPDMKYLHQIWSQAREMKGLHAQSVKKAEASHVQFMQTEEGWRLVKV